MGRNKLKIPGEVNWWVLMPDNAGGKEHWGRPSRPNILTATIAAHFSSMLFDSPYFSFAIYQVLCTGNR